MVEMIILMVMLMVVMEMVNKVDGDDILMVVREVVVKMILLMEMIMYF